MKTRLLLLAALALSACGVDSGAAAEAGPDAAIGEPADAGAGDAAPNGPDSGLPACTAPASVGCAAEVERDLAFQGAVASGAVTSTRDAAGWHSLVDARAGGMTPTESYVYARFTEQGLEKVELADAASLTSLGWDLAFRRFVIRVNSGSSGPGCVMVARVPGAVGFAELAAVPPAIPFHLDDFYTPPPQCTLISDSAGFQATPTVALSGFWRYSGTPTSFGCVQMTGAVYVLRLTTGKHVKLTVTSYYDPAAQQQCNAQGTVPQPSGSGNVRLDWDFLD